MSIRYRCDFIFSIFLWQGVIMFKVGLGLLLQQGCMCEESMVRRVLDLVSFCGEVFNVQNGCGLALTSIKELHV